MTDGLSIAGLARPTDALFEKTGRELEAARAASESSPEVAAQRFGQLLATMLVREMRKSLPEGFFGGAVGSETFESWMDDHLGRVLAEQDALGLAGMIKASLPGGTSAPVSEPQDTGGAE